MKYHVMAILAASVICLAGFSGDALANGTYNPAAKAQIVAHMQSTKANVKRNAAMARAAAQKSK